MRTYKPSHRPDFRYISIENAKKIDVGAYLLGFFGISGFGALRFKPISRRGSMEVIRVERGCVRAVAGALLCSKDRIRVGRISGTLAALGRRLKKDE